MPIALPTLPYPADALEPHISAHMLYSHFGKHHKKCVEKLNAALEGTRFVSWTLQRIVRHATAACASAMLRDNAAEAFSHSIYWNSLSPCGGGEPFGRIRNLVMSDFNSFSNFAGVVRDAGLSHIGEGWLWIVLDSGRLRIETTGTTDTPLGINRTPLLAFDLCEHAFYYDYCARKHDYLTACLEHLVNWETANAILDTCRGGAAVMASQALRARLAPTAADEATSSMTLFAHDRGDGP